MIHSSLGTIDWSILIIYLLIIVGIGIFAGFTSKNRKGNEGANYFLAGNSLKWPMIGLAIFAANISTVHLVGNAESAYQYGLVNGNYEWMAGFTLILMALFFAPLYLRSKVGTLSDFLERRYNRKCRDILTGVSLFSAIVLHMGVALYTAALVLRGLLGHGDGATLFGFNELYVFVAGIGLLTGIYTMYGGLLAVVWTESVQTVLLFIGAITILVTAYIKIGGWHNLSDILSTHAHPLKDVPQSAYGESGNFLSVIRDGNDKSGMPWYAFALGHPIIAIWYFCCDQTIVQRVLAAKDERHARLGPLFCAFLKIWPMFLFVLPGVICVALVQTNAFGGAQPATAKDTYTFLLTNLLPVGLKGLVAAAMLSAAMQTCSAALNSIATLVALDIFKRNNPAIQDHSLVKIGKATTIVGTVLAIVASPIFGLYPTLLEAINTLICYVAPPITAIFVIGVFWKKASGKAAYITFVSGIIIGAVFCTLGLTKQYNPNFLIMAFIICMFCCALLIICSYIFPEPLKPEAKNLVWTSWREPLQGTGAKIGFGDYRVQAGLILLMFLILYYIFR